MTQLDGPRWGPREGGTEQRVVLCHGLGADGHDLIDLAPHWAWLRRAPGLVQPAGRTFLIHVHGFDLFSVQDLDCHLVPRERVLRHLHLVPQRPQRLWRECRTAHATRLSERANAQRLRGSAVRRRGGGRR